MSDHEKHWRDRLDQLRQEKAAAVARFDKQIEEAERLLKMHVRSRTKQERNWSAWVEEHSKLTSDERVERWLRRFTGVGPHTAKLILVELGGASGLWEKVRAHPQEELPVKVPWKVRETITQADAPPWDQPQWW